MASAMLLGSAATAATATTAATAATAGLFGVGGAFSVMSTLSTVGGLFSAISSMNAGNAASEDYAVQASWERVKAANEDAKGTQDRIKQLQQLKRIQAQNFATYAARGITLEGTPMTVAEENTAEAERNLDISRYNTAQGIDSAKGQEAALRSKSAYAASSGRAKAAGTLFDLGSRLYDKGFGS